jgi:hypothetical protein
MREKLCSHLDFIQNLTIALLSVSAVLLFAQTQLYNLGVSTSLRSFLSEGEQTIGTVTSVQTDTAISAPVRVAITGTFGRYGNVTLTTTDDEFEPLQALLEQALGSARTYTASDSRAFLTALEGTSVYYDFLSPLPLSVLAQLAGTTGSEDFSARRLILTPQDDEVVLYLWDDDTGYLRCDTALSAEALADTVSQYELGNACFALERPEAAATAPYSLLLEEPPALSNLTASVPLSDTDLLMTLLGFHPNTQYHYEDATGADVVVESGRTLRIRSDGTVTYADGGSDALTVTPAEETLTLTEAAKAARELLDQLLSVMESDASLYLEDIRQDGDSFSLTFNYQVDGVPIRFADDQSAAQVTISGNTVSSMTLRLRQYTADGDSTQLLPLRQALAIAGTQEGAELSIGYIDNGGSTVSAGWLAE